MKDFLQNFAEQFDDTPVNVFTPETKFKDLEEWNSMIALSIIAMVDEKYGKKVTGTDLKNADSIADLEQILQKQ